MAQAIVDAGMIGYGVLLNEDGGEVYSNGSVRIQIPTSGNVGIGSLNPGQTLDVTGTVRANTFYGNGSSGIGWSVHTGANTACNTTCGATSACVFGFDTGLGSSDVVACTDATADTCVCAGP